MKSSENVMIFYIMLIIFYVINTHTIIFGKTGSSNNGLLKKRVAERQASHKVDILLDQVQDNSMQELAKSLENLNKICDLLQVSSVNHAIKKIENMQADLDKLLAALDVSSVDIGIKKAKQIVKVSKKLLQLQ